MLTSATVDRQRYGVFDTGKGKRLKKIGINEMKLSSDVSKHQIVDLNVHK